MLGSARPKIDRIGVENNGFLSARIVAFLSVAGRLARWGELLEAPASELHGAWQAAGVSLVGYRGRAVVARRRLPGGGRHTEKGIFSALV